MIAQLLLSTDHLLYPPKSDGGISQLNKLFQLYDDRFDVFFFCRIPLCSAIYQFDSLYTLWERAQWLKLNVMGNKKCVSNANILSHKFWKSHTHKHTPRKGIRKGASREREREHIIISCMQTPFNRSHLHTAEKESEVLEWVWEWKGSNCVVCVLCVILRTTWYSTTKWIVRIKLMSFEND